MGKCPRLTYCGILAVSLIFYVNSNLKKEEIARCFVDSVQFNNFDIFSIKNSRILI